MEGNGYKPFPLGEPVPVCAALAAVIRERRLRRGWSLTDLAARTGLSHPMMRFVEKGERIPSIDTAARVSRAFGVSLSRLILDAEKLL
jgi:transcriptional regulator with XRE-family HTH domain